ncbi:MAG TPA: hypothetical protein VFS00_25230, partial [Polyangiaceae bacterium]|nr:hypothetical protein [Polyangiaceae bacterium]
DAVRAALFRWNDRHDADDDGVTDLEEMMGGANPNAEGEEPEAEPPPAEASGSSGASSNEPSEPDEPRFQVRPGQKMGGCSYADVAAVGGAREALLLALAALARRLATKRRAERQTKQALARRREGWRAPDLRRGGPPSGRCRPRNAGRAIVVGSSPSCASFALPAPTARRRPRRWWPPSPPRRG